MLAMWINMEENSAIKINGSRTYITVMLIAPITFPFCHKSKNKTMHNIE